ncbi:MAG: hypothetical protein LBS00_01510 [Synergistaceae bacterium]|nr:hypothetical protein [Synergistaceae bacterium]
MIIKITSMPPGVYIYPASTVCMFVLFLWCWASGRWETKLGKFVSYFPILPLLAGVLFIADTISGPMTSKPVIYLYPEKTTEVSVRVKYNGALTHTWPPYGDGWKVTAHSDGMLVNHADGREYSYLFWEGEANFPCDFSSGFVVKGSDTGEFLREKLAFMGLTPREYNEFIVYWLPLTEGNAWNLISFQMVEWGGSEIK